MGSSSIWAPAPAHNPADYLVLQQSHWTCRETFLVSWIFFGEGAETKVNLRGYAWFTRRITKSFPQHKQLFKRARRASAQAQWAPLKYSSIAFAALRPSAIAHTTKDWPRRMSPAAKTFGTEVA